MESVTLEDVAVEFIQEWALLGSARRSLCRYGMLDQCRTLTSRGTPQCKPSRVSQLGPRAEPRATERGILHATGVGAGAVPEDAAGALYRSEGDTVDSRGPASSPGAALVSGMHGTKGRYADSEGVDTSAYTGPPRPVGGRGFCCACTGPCLASGGQSRGRSYGSWAANRMFTGTSHLCRCGCGVHPRRMGVSGLYSEKPV
ncbi:hypothetical protein H8959_017867 [Pygathrix nigripes]